MLAVSSIAVTLWLGGRMRPFPNCWAAYVGHGVPVSSGAHALRAGGRVLPRNHTNAEIRQFRIQTIGLGTFGALLGFVGLVLLVPAVRVRIQDIYWFVVKVAFFTYLYIWYRGTFPAIALTSS